MASNNNSAMDYENNHNDYSHNKDSIFTDHTLTSRSRLRTQMQDDIEQFIKNGGEVKHIPKNLRNDPPKKPQSNYGSRPI